MFYLLEDRYYPNGYAIEQINCIDLSFAQALGIYHEQLYYDYCAYLSIDGNFCNENYFDSQKALCFLGFEKIPLSQLGGNGDLIGTIKEALQYCYPIMLMTNYECLYYSDGYMSPGVNDHATIVMGYDDEKELIILKEFEAVRRKYIEYTKGQLFYMQRLKTHMFMEIVSETKKHYGVTDKEFTEKNIFVIKPSSYAIGEEYSIKLKSEDIRSYFIENCSCPLKLLQIHRYYNGLTDEGEINTFFRYIRRPYFGGMSLLLDYMEAFFDKSENIKQAAENLMKSIDRFISVSHKVYLREKTYLSERLSEAVAEVEAAQGEYVKAVIRNK